MNIHTAFHAGAHQQVVDFDTSAFSAENALPVRVLKLRSQIALGQSKEIASSLAKESTPDLVAVRLLAEYEGGKDVVGDVKKLVEKAGQENLTVQLIAGIILERAGETEEALSVLSKHQGSLDAYVSKVRVMGENFADGLIVQRRPDCPDPSATESHRPCIEGSTARAKMGTGQPLGQLG